MKKKILLFDDETIAHPELLSYLKGSIHGLTATPIVVNCKKNFFNEINNKQFDVILINFTSYYFSYLDGKKLNDFVLKVKKIQPTASYIIGVIGLEYQKKILENLKAYSIFKRFTMSDICGITGSLNPYKSNGTVTIDGIKTLVSKKTEKSEYFLSQMKQKTRIIRGRQIGMYLSKEFTKHSLKSIGKEFGRKDHTTVIHSCQKIKDLMDTDHQFKMIIVDLRLSVSA